MIRVIYEWSVPKENFAEFEKVWMQTTNNIHETVNGALGSFMLKSHEEPTKVLTIAKWDSLESWQAFWGNQNPEAMQTMRTLGERINAHAYEERADFTR